MLATPSNRLISVAEDRYLKVWDLRRCQVISELFHSCKINYLFYNPTL